MGGGGYGGRPNLLYGKLCSEDQLQQLGVSLEYVPPEGQLSSSHRAQQQLPSHGESHFKLAAFLSICHGRICLRCHLISDLFYTELNTS